MCDSTEQFHVELGASGAWEPDIGSEALALLARTPLSAEAQRRVADEAAAILGSGVPVTSPSGHATGLVVGYVQSGKTLSFTTVAALARDNRYPLVIVITGTSTSLTGQSRTRIAHDLELESRPVMTTWMPFHNPRLNPELPVIAAALHEWQDDSIPEDEKPTVLITVMKQHTHLGHLVEVLEGLPLEGKPVLIIDDEADQASLNTLTNQNEESTTYSRLSSIRHAVPHHAFLQYTATPQGPLLINIIDALSPDFAHVLVPGEGYTGGATFFGSSNSLTADIPLNDIPSPTNIVTEPPESLLEALRIFFLGVASGLARGDLSRGHRSMIVHPSQRTDPQRQYFSWVTFAQREWTAILVEERGQDYEDLIEEFQAQYNELQGTIDDLEEFDELIGHLLRSIRRTLLHEVNASQGRTPEIPWNLWYSHILVGGQALDRGYTVEGLTVTYMPRPLGGGNADTLQQRARFFGYKSGYLGYCRVYLHPDVRQAFTDYVEHERYVRQSLEEFAADARPLNEMRRAFLLDRALRPTRGNILDIDYVRIRGRENWILTRAPHLGAQRNLEDAQRFVQSIDFAPDPYIGQGDDRRTLAQRHHFNQSLPLRLLNEELLLNLQFSDIRDAQDFLGLLMIIRAILHDNEDEECCLYLMSPDATRMRSLDNGGYVPNLMQGAAPVNPEAIRGSIYPGDRALFDDGRITLQLHLIEIREPESGRIVAPRALALASRIPAHLQRDAVIQDQGNLIEAN